MQKKSMADFQIPLAITYDTKGTTPIGDVISALQAASIAIEDAVSLLPSVAAGVRIEHSSINVRSITQQSPLRELFALTLVVAFQDNLETEIPPAIETLLGFDISENYDSIVTVLTMIVLFYGASFLKDALTKTVEDSALRDQVQQLIAHMAAKTGKTEAEVQAIFDAKYSKPGTVRRLTKAVKGFFVPTQREGGVAMQFDRQIISSDVIREVPMPGEFDDKEDFEKYTAYHQTKLEIHAQDRDRISVGWAAVPSAVSDKRLKMRLIEPVTVQDLWTKETVIADIVVVSKLTGEGYVPSEIHLTRVYE